MSEPIDYDDPATLDTEEELDEDELGADPMDGYDAPDEPSGVDRWGTTPAEEREGESLDQRLSEEEPDIQP